MKYIIMSSTVTLVIGFLLGHWLPSETHKIFVDKIPFEVPVSSKICVDKGGRFAAYKISTVNGEWVDGAYDFVCEYPSKRIDL